jgi:hypothetical protein
MICRYLNNMKVDWVIYNDKYLNNIYPLGGAGGHTIAAVHPFPSNIDDEIRILSRSNFTSGHLSYTRYMIILRKLGYP